MPTIKDVAQRCGVAKSTVSNIINGKGNVGSQMRDRVLQVIEEMGYVPSTAARALSLSRHGLNSEEVHQTRATSNYSDGPLRAPSGSHQLNLAGALVLAIEHLRVADIYRCTVFLAGDAAADTAVSQAIATISDVEITIGSIARTSLDGMSLAIGPIERASLDGMWLVQAGVFPHGAMVFVSPAAAVGFAAMGSLMRVKQPPAICLVDVWELNEEGSRMSAVFHEIPSVKEQTLTDIHFADRATITPLDTSQPSVEDVGTERHRDDFLD